MTPPTGRTALVLSAGGLFGAYHAGVWRYLSEVNIRPDIVVGASVGALNGWAIAGECRASELTEQWLDEKRSNVLLRRKEAGWRSGYCEREPLKNLVTEIFPRYRPSCDFGVVAVELPFLRTRLFSGDSVTAKHLLATVSIPLAMPAVSIDGKTFTDGGLLENVPLWAAVQMGANRIIAVDAMHFDCPWWYRAGVSPMRLLAPRPRSNVKIATTVIRPRQSLGHYSNALNWSRPLIEGWLELGYTDACRCLRDTAANEALRI